MADASWFSPMLYERYIGWRDAIGAIVNSHHDTGDWVIIITGSIICLTVWWNFFSNQLRTLPGPWQLPVIGNLYPFLYNFDEFQESVLRWNTIYGPVWQLRLPVGAGKGDGRVTMLSDRQDIAWVLELRERGEELFGLCADFTSMMEVMFGVPQPFHPLQQKLAKIVDRREWKDYVYHCTLNVATRAITNPDTPLTPSSSLQAPCFAVSLGVMVKLWVGDVTIDDDDFARLHKAVFVLQADVLERCSASGTVYEATATALVRQCRRLVDHTLEGAQHGREDLVSRLAASRVDAVDLSRAFAFSLFLGTHMISNSLIWSLTTLTAHTEELDRARRDCVRIAEPGQKSAPTPGFLSQCTREVERLYPPIPHIFRFAYHDTQLPSGHRVCAGETVVCSVLAAGRHRRNFMGVDVFDPERWSEDEIAEANMDYASLFTAPLSTRKAYYDVPSRETMRDVVTTATAAFLLYTRDVDDGTRRARTPITTNVTTTPPADVTVPLAALVAQVTG